MAGDGRCADAQHHTRQPLEEWLLQVMQWLDARRALERRDLLHSDQGPNPDRSLAAALQQHQATQLVGPPAPETATA